MALPLIKFSAAGAHALLNRRNAGFARQVGRRRDGMKSDFRFPGIVSETEKVMPRRGMTLRFRPHADRRLAPIRSGSEFVGFFKKGA